MIHAHLRVIFCGSFGVGERIHGLITPFQCQRGIVCEAPRLWIEIAGLLVGFGGPWIVANSEVAEAQNVIGKRDLRIERNSLFYGWLSELRALRNDLGHAQ